MYHLVVTVRETLWGADVSAFLSDVDDSGRTSPVASHGPVPMSPGESQQEGLGALLDHLARYSTFLNGPATGVSRPGVS